MIIDMNKNMIEMMTYSKVREGVRRLTSGHLGYANNEVSKLVWAQPQTWPNDLDFLFVKCLHNLINVTVFLSLDLFKWNIYTISIVFSSKILFKINKTPSFKAFLEEALGREQRTEY